MSNIFRRVLTFVTDITIGHSIRRRQRNRTINQPMTNLNSQNEDAYEIDDLAIPSLSQSTIKYYERANLIDSSSNTFGNQCLRLINIAFQINQTFSSMMNTCATISQYLKKHLTERYPGEYFHIIIGENNEFGFAISDGNYFAEIEQEQYRVVIFTTNKNRKIEYSLHDANSQMILEWKSTLAESSKK